MPAVKRKIPKRYGIKDPKRMSKWRKKLVGRQHGRKARGKKPLAEPLTMSKQEVVKGNLILKNGRRNVSIPLMLEGEALQGVYRMENGEIVIARSMVGPTVYPQKIRLFKVVEGFERRIKDEKDFAFFEIPKGKDDLGHMYLPEKFRGTGIAGRHASRVDRHYRQRRQRKNTFWMSKYRKELFDGILKKIGYTRGKVEEHDLWIYHKTGEVRRETDMSQFHLIEAIDPKTGRKREYVFPVEQVR